MRGGGKIEEGGRRLGRDSIEARYSFPFQLSNGKKHGEGKERERWREKTEKEGQTKRDKLAEQQKNRKRERK